MSGLQKIARPALRASVRQYGGGSAWQKPNYDVLPVPKGSWQEDFNRRNAHGNLILAIGLVAGVATLAHSLVNPLPEVTRADLPSDPRKF